LRVGERNPGAQHERPLSWLDGSSWAVGEVEATAAAPTTDHQDSRWPCSSQISNHSDFASNIHRYSSRDPVLVPVVFENPTPSPVSF
jgi:hypothetical protein